MAGLGLDGPEKLTERQSDIRVSVAQRELPSWRDSPTRVGGTIRVPLSHYC